MTLTPSVYSSSQSSQLSWSASHAVSSASSACDGSWAATAPVSFLAKNISRLRRMRALTCSEIELGISRWHCARQVLVEVAGADAADGAVGLGERAVEALVVGAVAIVAVAVAAAAAAVAPVVGGG